MLKPKTNNTTESGVSNPNVATNKKDYAFSALCITACSVFGLIYSSYKKERKKLEYESLLNFEYNY